MNTESIIVVYGNAFSLLTVNSGLNTEPKQVYVGILRNTAMTFRILRVWSVKENAAEFAAV